MALTSWGYDALKDASGRRAIAWIRCAGATDIAFVTENVVDPANGRITASPGKVGPGPSLAEAVAFARSLGLKVTIKPHYLLSTTSDHLSYPPYQPPDTFGFFDGLRANLLEHARLAQSSGADRLVVGTELGGHLTGPEWRFMWRKIVAQLREVFRGSLTYSATFDTEWKTSRGANEAAFVSFWDVLDEVGINLYPKLTRAPDPDAGSLERAYRRNDDGDDVVAVLRQFAGRVGKPILFMEHGFRSLRGNFWDTGSWGGKANPVDAAAQAKVLDVSLGVWRNEGGNWLKGAFLWEVPAAERTAGNQDWWDKGFVFRGKPAAEVVRRHYAGTPPRDSAGAPIDCAAP